MKSFKVRLIISILVVTFFCILSTATFAQTGSLPEFYGVYLRQGEKVIPLKQGNLTFRTGLKLADIRTGLYGIENPPDIKIDVAPIEILYYEPNISPSKARLSCLVYIASAPANFFDVKKPKTSRTFFRNVYGVSYYKKIPINLWCVDHNIRLRIAPVDKKPGMYRLVPQKKLVPNNIYVVNFGSVGGPTYFIGNLKFYPFSFGEVAVPRKRK
jgi:hypothetical protein